MKKSFLIFSTVILFICAAGQPPTDPRLKGLDTFALKVLKDWNAAGVTIAVVEKGKTVYTGGFGYRDLDKKLPVTENTQFAIGSCTKAFTASMLGMLQKEDKLDIDKPVRTYLPELKFQNEYTNDHCTLRDMMCHRTGLPRHDLSWYASWASRNELLERIQYMEPTAELRAKWQYNNFMFMAQGIVIEKITGKSWEENMKERILKPLGMDNTNLSTNDMEKSADHSLAFATKDSSLKAIAYRNIDAMGPAGSVNSCAKDMAKWLITWINNGKYQGKEIFPATYRNDAITIQMAMGGGTPGADNPDVHISGYGFGWMMSSYRGHYRVEHGGGIDGFITTTGFFPSDSIGIFVSSNQGGVSTSIRNFIADRMLKLSYRNWSKMQLDGVMKARDAAKAIKKNDSIGHKFNTKPSQELKNYTGTYKSPGYGSIEISMKDGGLVSKFNAIDIRLDHFHYDQFNAVILDPALEGQDPIRFTFHIDVSGDITKLTVPFEGGVKDIEFVKETKAIAVKKSDLEKYVGEYELQPGAIAKFYIKGENTLYAFIEGQPEFELIATDKNKFDLKIMKGYSVTFEENAKGEIVAASFVQPNGTFKAKKEIEPRLIRLKRIMRKKFLLIHCLIAGIVLISCYQKEKFDTIIRNGMIYDGNGGEPYKGDIGINADTIVFIGDLSKASAKNEVDAKGKAVAPGFIDTHSHHAGNLFKHRDFIAAVSQGITTIIIGQDGGSYFPLSKFYKELADTPVAVNIASYSGHNTLRDSVLGKDFKRFAMQQEIDKMKTLLQEDMEAGAFGLSTGLEYDPGIYSSNDEILQLAKVVTPFGGRYISHIRSEDRYFWKAIDEIVTIGKEAKIPVQVSHIKLAMHNIWGKADSLLALFEEARKNGIDITADIYPYAFWNSTIKVLFPDRNFSDEKEAELILKEITLPDDIILGSYEVNPAYAGKSLAEIAKLENKSPARMLVELIGRIDEWEKKNDRECQENIMAISMSEADIKKLMQWSHTNICSDGSSAGTHPRGYGAFTRVFGNYVKKEKALTMAQAIHKMTGLSAQQMGIKKRGLIKTGYYADLVMFDPETVSDQATIAEPHKLSNGIEKVWVNGTIIFENKKTTELYPGKIVKRQ